MIKSYKWIINRLDSSFIQGKVFYYINNLLLNKLIDKNISIKPIKDYFFCFGCNKQCNKTIKGYCYTCFKTKPYCDFCMVQPHLCHYHFGTCRDSKWGLEHCFAKHYIYLSFTSGLKVGITRHSNMITRAINQGSINFLPILAAKSRRIAGLIEHKIGKSIGTGTAWRKMLTTNDCNVDLNVKKDIILKEFDTFLDQIKDNFGQDAYTELSYSPIKINYPITKLPDLKNQLDLNNDIIGNLLGIKGQYLILSGGYFNINKFIGQQIVIQYE